MADNFRIPSKNNVIAQGLPKTGAGSKAGDPVRSGGLNGANLWGTGKGQGVPADSDYGMIALDGVIVTEVVVDDDVVENAPVYITPANGLTTAADDGETPTPAEYTLFGYTDEPATAGTVTIGVRISNAVGA